MSESQFHTTLHDNGVAEVVLDRPPVNALNAAGWNALAAEIEALGLRTEVRVIVIRAEGRASAPASTSRSSTPTKA
jgi:enoyl-CoA hydratase